MSNLDKFKIFIIATFFLSASFAYAQAPKQFTIDLACDSIPACIALLVANIVNYLLIPVAVVTIFISGFMFVFAGGSEDKVTTARKTLMWAVLGLVMAVGAEALAAAFQNFFINIGN